MNAFRSFLIGLVIGFLFFTPILLKKPKVQVDIDTLYLHNVDTIIKYKTKIINQSPIIDTINKTNLSISNNIELEDSGYINEEFVISDIHYDIYEYLINNQNKMSFNTTYKIPEKIITKEVFIENNDKRNCLTNGCCLIGKKEMIIGLASEVAIIGLSAFLINKYMK